MAVRKSEIIKAAVFCLVLMITTSCSIEKKPPKSIPTQPPKLDPPKDKEDPWALASHALVNWHRTRSKTTDICTRQPNGFELYRAEHCGRVLKKDGTEGGFGTVTYGDFDGDGHSDSAAVLRHKETKNLSLFIWFGKADSPQSLKQVRVNLPKNLTFNEETLEEYFSKAKFIKHKYKHFSFGETLNFPAELIFFASVPSPLFMSPKNEYNISRSILFVATGETYDVKLYIFDKTRSRAIVDYLETM